MLKVQIPCYYRVKNGQTIKQIAFTFGVAERLLVKENKLTCEPSVGQILYVPKREIGNALTAYSSATKTLLCGNESNFEKRNGTAILYPGMRVVL